MIVGITGKKRHGKGTVGGILVREYGFTQIDFTDALNYCLQVLNPIIERDGGYPLRYADALKRHGYDGMKDRYPEAVALQQRMGTDVGRNIIDPDLWTKLWRKSVDDHLTNGYENIVVTNVRFDNEADMVSLMNGTIIQVVRPGYVHDAELDKHISERGISKHWVDNKFLSTTVEDLENWTRQFAQLHSIQPTKQ